MRRLLWCFLGFLALPAWALAPLKPFAFNDFHCGVDSYHSPLTINDCFVQDALNVYFDKSAAAEKRKGFTVFVSSKSYSYTGAWSYTDASNNIWLVARSSDSIMATTGVGTNSFTVKIATVSSVDTVNSVNAFGDIFFVDPTQGVYYWNGTATTFVSGSPKGSLITEFHGRIWVAGLGIPNGNQLYGSKYLDGTVWTTGPNATDPVQFQIGLNDQFDVIAAFFAGFNDTLYIFKNYSINALYGFDQTDFQIRVLNKEVGCIDQRSVQPIFGGLVFASPRGIEFFDGYTATRISDSIKDKVDPITLNSSFAQTSWLQSTNADFNQWTTTNLDTTTLTNQVQLYHPSDQFANLNAWSQVGGSWSASGNTAIPSVNTHTALVYKTSTIVPNSMYRVGASISVPNGSAGTVGMVNASTQGYVTVVSWNSAVQVPWAVAVWKVNGLLLAATSINANFGVADGNYHYWELKQNGSSLSAYVDGALAVSGTDTTYTGLSFPYLGSNVGAGGTTPAANFQNFNEIALTTGTFVTPAHALGSISAFGNMNVTQTLNGGTIAYAICTAANSGMTSASCASQTPNSQVSIATNAYVQINATFTVTSSSSIPALSNLSLQWFSGSHKPPMASAVYDNRYWLSVTTNTADAVNDATLILSKGPVWSIFSTHAGAFTIFKNGLYHGDSDSTGNFYQDEQGYSDNGGAINAYIKTKDYSPDGWMIDKWFKTLYATFDNGGAYTVNTSYFLDGASTAFSLAPVLENEQAGRNYAKLPFPVGTSNQNFGKSVSFKFSNSEVNAPMKLYGGILYYRTRMPL